MDYQKALVGALILDYKKFFDVAPMLRDGDLFGLPNKVFTAITEMITAGKPVNLASIHGNLPDVSAIWLAETTDLAFPSMAVSYAENVANSGKMIRITDGIKRAERSFALGPDYVLDDLMGIYNSEKGVARNDATAKEVAGRFSKIQAENRRRGFLGVSTGFDCFDSRMAEYIPGHCWVFGAEPGGGKTAFAIEVISRTNAKTIIFSTEMAEEQIVARYIANKTGIDSKLILAGRLAGDAERKVEQERVAFSKRNIRVYDNIYDLADIRAETRKAAMQGGVDLIIVDYVQNCTATPLRDEYAVQTELARSFQALTKEVRCCGLFLSQIPNDFIANNKEGLTFKGSGAWRAIADVGVLICQRPDIKERRRFDVRKHRHGPLFKQDFDFMGGFTRLEEVFTEP